MRLLPRAGGAGRISRKPHRRNKQGALRRTTVWRAARSSIYDDITTRIIAELEAGRLPWVQPWGTASAKAPLALPRNAATSRQYSGINILILWGAVVQQGYPSQAWLTFRQALALGGNVRKGERGTTVVYADRFTPEDEKRRARETGDPPGQIPLALLQNSALRRDFPLPH